MQATPSTGPNDYRWILAPRNWAGPARRLHPVHLMLILALAIYILALHVSMIAAMWIPYGYLGKISIGEDHRVSWVDPASPLFDAGLTVGDVVRPVPNTLGERMALLQDRALPPNMPVTVEVARDSRTFAIHAVAREERLQKETILVLKRLAGVAFLVVGVALVWVRPGPATSAFYVFALTALDYNITLASRLPQEAFFFVWLFSKVIEASAPASILVFGWAFPHNRWEQMPKWVWRGAVGVFLTSAAINLNGPMRAVLTLDLRHYPLLEILKPTLTYGAVGAGCVGLLTSYLGSRGEDRQKVVWIGAAMILGAVSWRMGNLPSDTYPIASSGYFNLLRLALPVAVAYTIMRYRVLDLRAFLAHTFMAAALGVVVTVAFLILEFFFHPHLPEGATIVIQAAVALITGLVMHWWLGRTHQFIESLVFRRRHRSLRSMERLSAKIASARSVDSIVQMTTRHARRLLSLEFAAAYGRKSGGQLGLIGCDLRQAGIPHNIVRTDRIVHHLTHAHHPVVVQILHSQENRPLGHQTRAIAIPVCVDNRLHGALFYGFHCNGAALDFEELNALKALADAAGVAVERLRMENLQRSLRYRTRELAALRGMLGVSVS